MKRIIISTLCLVFSFAVFTAKSQQISVSLETFLPLVGSSNSNALSVSYIHPLKNDFKWVAGTEVALVPWGIDLTANAGVLYSKSFAKNWSWSVDCTTNQGFAMFKPSVLYVWGLSASGGVEYSFGSKSSVALNTGLRYTACPAYKNYSLISDFWSVPVELSYRIKLK